MSDVMADAGYSGTPAGHVRTGAHAGPGGSAHPPEGGQARAGERAGEHERPGDHLRDHRRIGEHAAVPPPPSPADADVVHVIPTPDPAQGLTDHLAGRLADPLTGYGNGTDRAGSRHGGTGHHQAGEIGTAPDVIGTAPDVIGAAPDVIGAAPGDAGTGAPSRVPGPGPGPAVPADPVVPADPGGPAGPGGPAVPGVPGAAATAVVKGRIQIEDEVVEKIAALAAVEVDGVADLGGDLERTLESVRGRIGLGHRRGDQGVRARIEDRQVSVNVTIVIEYGHVVTDVAKAVKANVARAVSRMLGLRVVEVNVTVDDVTMPRPARTGDPGPAPS